MKKMTYKKIMWSLIVFIVIGSYLMFSKQNFLFCQMDKISEIKSLDRKTSAQQTKTEKTDAVILLTMMRSGSSILGSIFDERANVTYLYEPLFPFGENGVMCKNETGENALDVLRFAATCKFENFQALYQPTDRFDKHAK